MAGAVLITGASGYVGGLVARQYLEAGVPVLTHGRRVVDALAAGHPVAGDLTDGDPFAAVTADWRDRITSIVHAGAVTRFDVEPDLAQSVNVEGTEKVVEFARRCPRLESLALVSTVYATGLRGGPVAEELYDDEPGFANAYERSKWQAEQVVAATNDLPWRILRVATVIADDDSGG